MTNDEAFDISKIFFNHHQIAIRTRFPGIQCRSRQQSTIPLYQNFNRNIACAMFHYNQFQNEIPKICKSNALMRSALHIYNIQFENVLSKILQFSGDDIVGFAMRKQSKRRPVLLYIASMSGKVFLFLMKTRIKMNLLKWLLIDVESVSIPQFTFNFNASQTVVVL